MTKRLVVAGYPIGGRKAYASVIFEEQRAIALVLSPADEEASSDLGNIFVGRIEKVQKNLGAAFVRYREDRTGYLPVKGDNHKAGDTVIVQVEKEAIKTKLPRLTEKISIGGRYLAIAHGNGGLRLSRKLSEDSRNRLKELFTEYRIPECDVIIRTNAAGASQEELFSEWNRIGKRYRDICQYGQYRTLYSCLYRKNPVYIDMLNELSAEEVTRIVTDEEAVYRALDSYISGLYGEEESSAKTDAAHLPAPVFYRDDMVALYKLYSLSTLLTECMTKTVWLKSGGSIVIEQTEAFVCVDVNSGRYEGRKPPEEMIRMTNLEALEETVRQIRLRCLSGTILVDLINDRNGSPISYGGEFPKPHQTDNRERELCDYTENLLRKYRIPARVIDITGLGILEIACTKSRKSLKEQIEELK